MVLLAVTATVVAVLAMLPSFETAGDTRVLLDETVATPVVSVVPDARRVAVVAVLETFVNTVLATPAVRAVFVPSMDVPVDTDSEVVVAFITVVDVMRLRDVDKSSVPPPSPSWSRDVCPVCLVLVLMSVTATVVAVLAMLPFFETAIDVLSLIHI